MAFTKFEARTLRRKPETATFRFDRK